MQQKGFCATHFLPITHIQDPGLTSLDQLLEMQAGGWETGGHGIDHGNLSALPLKEAQQAIDSTKKFFDEHGLTSYSYAYAFGNYTPQLLLYTATKFQNIRTSHDFLYLSGVNPQELGYYAVKSNTTTIDLINRVERARTEGSPLVIIGFHALRDSDEEKPQSYWVSTETFQNFLSYLDQSDALVLPLNKAMDLLIR